MKGNEPQVFVDAYALQNALEDATRKYISNMVYSLTQGSTLTNLDNGIGCLQNASKEVDPMAHKRIRVLVGEDVQGKPIYRQISGSTQDERNDNIVKAYIENNRIQDFLSMYNIIASATQKPKHIFSEYAWGWYNRYKVGTYAETTKGTQKGNIKSLTNYFKAKAIEDISIDDVQDYLNSISNFTDVTVRGHLKTLSQILNAAHEEGYINRNPAASKRLRNPGRKAKGIKTLSVLDCRKVLIQLPSIEDDCIRLLLALFIYTGLRREEILGLEWQDINFNSGYIYINKAVVTPISTPLVKETKTQASTRDLPMSDNLKAILYACRKNNGFVISDDEGKPFNQYRYKKLWKQARQIVGIPNLDARQLRHTFATMHVASGTDLKTVSAWLGHTNISTTANIYTQVEPTHMYNTRNALSDYVLGMQQ